MGTHSSLRPEFRVADLGKGSMHTYGIAVELTIVDGNGEHIDMDISPLKKKFHGNLLGLCQAKGGYIFKRAADGEQRTLTCSKAKGRFSPLAFREEYFNGMEKG